MAGHPLMPSLTPGYMVCLWHSLSSMPSLASLVCVCVCGHTYPASPRGSSPPGQQGPEQISQALHGAGIRKCLWTDM